MLKNIVILALLETAMIVSAQNTTVGIVGVTRVSKPAASLNLIGNNFGDATTTLNDLAPIDQFKGSFLPGYADRIYEWNPAITNYVTYLLYEQGATKEWRLASNFANGSGENPVVPVGSAFWLLSSGGSSNTNLYLSGNVVASQVVTNQILPGLQLISYPFSSDVDLNDMSIKENATGSFLPGNADRIYVWDVSITNYNPYLLYEQGGTKEWRKASSFGAPAGPAPVDLGQGFWYQAKNGFTWIETNAYFNSL